MKVTICSSIDFSPDIIEIKKQLEERGHVVNIPFLTQKIQNKDLTHEEFMQEKENAGGDILIREAHQVDLIKRHRKLIQESDAILVLNLSKKGVEGYIGGNTLMEMGFAYGHDKKIFLFNPIPKKSERMHYIDEIVSVKPIIVDGDLSKIV